MKYIIIGDVAFPTNEFAIAGTALLGIRKSGKTYCANGIAEQLMDQGIPIVVFDAIGTWRHLRTPALGNGFPVVVAGGEDGDIQLTPQNVSELVRAAMRSNINLVIDLYNPKLSKADLGKCERAILAALAQHPNGREANQISILTGYSSGSGGFNNSLSRLRGFGFITRGVPIRITAEGVAALGAYDPLPVGEELRRHWLVSPLLGTCERKILTSLIVSYPDGMTSEMIAAETGYSPGSGGFNNALSRLRTLELIERGHPIKAHANLFQ